MMRKSARWFVGYTPINPDTSPMLQYSNYHWHYNFPQGMEHPQVVNRTKEVPFIAHRRNVNQYQGVWVELDMPVAYRVALAPQLEKLALGRQVPKTPVAEAAADFEKYSPLIQDSGVKEAWLAKVAQLGGFQKSSEDVLRLWKTHMEGRYTRSSPEAAAPSGAAVPHTALVIGMLFSLAASGNAEWKSFFQRCLKGEWNLTPQFPISLWNELLRNCGKLGDEQGVVLLLEEMLDVHADVEHLGAQHLVHALNVVTSPEAYNYVKKYLFHFSERKVRSLSKTYFALRNQDDAEENGLKNNDAMFYHVQWHKRIREPQSFSPRQLYFDYEPSAVAKATHNPNAKIDTVVKEKIEKWKQEGLLPEDYEHTDKVYDRSAAYKNIIRQEKWKKWPKIVKDPKYGYSGEP